MSLIAILLLLTLELTGLAPQMPTGMRQTLVSSALPKAALGGHHMLVNGPYSTMALPQATAPEISLGAAAVISIDTSSGAVLYEHNSDAQRPIASITKLITTLVILTRHTMSETITIPQLPIYGPDDAVIHLVPGEKFTLGDVLKAALIPSANDAADSLAIVDSGSVAAFSERMNQLATTWNIDGTHFNNSSGLVDAGNYATARSLSQIARLALTNPTVRGIVNTQSSSISSSTGHSYPLATTNHLLKDSRFHGIKTGYTQSAGQSVVSLAMVAGHPVITVVLGSPDRFGETTRLINYLEGAIQWQ
jgi:serine-type D-Ala-D-Ala carboxypeptidase (penicillin-binding protein 5/6)